MTLLGQAASPIYVRPDFTPPTLDELFLFPEGTRIFPQM